MKLYNLIFTLIFTSSSAYATGVTIPNAFSSGTTTSAAEMNANFTAVKSAVDDNDSRINTLEGSVSAPTSQFMGFSSGTTDGAGGLIGMSNLCHTSFSGSHICSTVEFGGSIKNSATGVSGTAWIRPVITGDTNLTDIESGIEGNSGTQLSCQGWNSNSVADTGLSVDDKGSINRTFGVLSTCEVQRSVACCK